MFQIQNAVHNTGMTLTTNAVVLEKSAFQPKIYTEV